MRGRMTRPTRTVLGALLAIALLAAIGANRTVVAQDQSLETVVVRVCCDGAERMVRTAKTTVGATLEEAGIVLNPADQVYPSLDTKPRKYMAIRIVRVVEKVIVKTEAVDCEIVRRPSRLLRPGQVRVLQDGSPGQRQKVFKAVYKNGILSGKTLEKDEVTVKPKDKIILVGDRRLSSRGYYRSRRVCQMHASAYDPGPRSCGKSADGYTATGMKAGYGVAAVDPRFIPLGTHLYIEGYGFAIAGDVGRAIKGRRIDLGFDTYYSAIQFGRKHVTVYILSK